MSKLLKKLKNWIYPHKCIVFRKYYSRNLKVCEDCKKESPLWDAKIRHQR